MEGGWGGEKRVLLMRSMRGSCVLLVCALVLVLFVYLSLVVERGTI